MRKGALEKWRNYVSVSALCDKSVTLLSREIYQGPLGITDFDKEGMLIEDFDREDGTERGGSAAGEWRYFICSFLETKEEASVWIPAIMAEAWTHPCRKFQSIVSALITDIFMSQKGAMP